MNRRIAIFALTILTLSSVTTYSAPTVLADWLIDRSGTIMELDQMVLGDDDEKVEPSEIRESQESSENSVQNTNQEQQREELKQQQEIKRETSKTAREQVREEAKQALERKIELNKKINKNVENEFEISATGGELKVKQKTKLSSGKEKEVELELKENETLHVEQEDGESVDIDATGPGELEIKKDDFKGRTRLPISVNSDNELMVTRPDGTTKVVTVLPDEAIVAMSKKGVIVDSDKVELTTDEAGEPIYEVKQVVSKKFLGLINMNFEVETTVSASDPNVVSTISAETSPWRRFLERLAR